MPKSVDANQRAIVYTLEAAGATVVSLHEVGRGCPDLLVGFRGINYLMEVKNPETHGRLTKQQLAWHAAWRGQADVVWDEGEALVAIGAVDKEDSSNE